MRCYVAGCPDLPQSHPQTFSSCSHILDNKLTCPIRKKSTALEQDSRFKNALHDCKDAFKLLKYTGRETAPDTV